ncbi:MAG TPA: thioredoxin family protein [Terriglobia bacterium]|nr:thioredoxin family protein [Terriglobia bacterium]
MRFRFRFTPTLRWIAAIATLSVAVGCAHKREGRPTATITPMVEREGVTPGSVLRVALKIGLPEGVHTQSNKPRDPLLIPTTLKIETPDGLAVDEIVWPAATDLAQTGQDEPLSVFEQEFLVGAGIAIDPAAPAGDQMIPAKFRYQACDEETCYPPVTAEVQWPVHIGASAGSPVHSDVFNAIPFGRGEKPGTDGKTSGAPAAKVVETASDPLVALNDFRTLASTGGYLRVGDFLGFLRNAENGVVEKGLFDGRGPLAILLIVFIGGLALNLTPCVLPMIPINLAIIGAGAKAGSRGRGFILGAAYGGAMALVYGALGLIVILTAGTFGTINASPWFNIGIAALFVVLGLAMFDILLIDFSVYSNWFQTDGKSRGSLVLAFSMGAVAALLAGACVAPVVIQVVLFASNLYATGTTVALALPFLLGIGMAIPWPLAGAGLASLPKPGPWMTRVKQAFGVLILVTAAYYAYVAYDLFSSRWVDPSAVASGVEQKLKEGWTPSLEQGLAQARREGKPVLIDMWATWCKNCLTMDKTTLNDPSVVKALDGYVKIKFQAETPDAPEIKPILDRFGVIGLPTYIVLRPKS